MQYLLDTNICVMYLNGRSKSVRQWLKEQSSDDIAVCSVVKAELFYGAQRSNNPQKTLAKQKQFLQAFISLLFDDEAAKVYAKIRATLAAAGTPIGPNDLQIAAIALVNELTLVTHNTKEFERVLSLPVVDWQID